MDEPPASKESNQVCKMAVVCSLAQEHHIKIITIKL